MRRKALNRVRQLILLSLCLAAAIGAIRGAERTFVGENRRQNAGTPPVKDLVLIGWNAMRAESSRN